MTDETTGDAAGDDGGFVLARHDAVDEEPVDAAPGLGRAVLVGEDDGAPQFALRRFVLAAGAAVPRHTNEVEHVQYALQGGYILGVGDEEHRIEPGDTTLIPAGRVHWYRNPQDHDVAFLCGVPHGDDAAELVED